MEQPVGIPMPQQVPRVISTSMGTVFGGETQGFKITLPITQIDQAAAKPAVAKAPQEVINETVSRLESEVRELRGELAKMQATLSASVPVNVEKTNIPNPLAPVKKVVEDLRK